MSVLRLTPEQVAAHQARVKRLPKVPEQATGAPAAPKPSKYKAQRTGAYASKKEASRADQLKLLEAAGEISELREQVRFVVIPKQDGERACKYVGDFTYRDKEGKLVCEDVKGFKTPTYRIKKKLMLLVHGIRIRET